MKRLKVVLLVSGFPSSETPSRSLFNKIGAENLGKLADVSIVQFSLWRPGRKFLYIDESNSLYKYYRVSIISPVVTSEKALCYQYKLFEKTASRKLASIFHSVDVIHSVGAHLSGVLGNKLGKIFSKPNVLQLTGSDVNINLPKLKDYKCFANLMSWTQGVGCNTRELKERFISLMGEAPYMPIIPNGVNINKFDFSPSIHSSSSAIQFLYLGGLPHYNFGNFGRNLKGGLTLLETWKVNEEAINRLNGRLTFAGPESDHEIAKEYISKMKYPEIIQIPGNYTPEDASACMRKSDVIIIPSMMEGLPNVAMEAGALGKCIIASNVGGLPDIIKHDENGLLVEPGDSVKLGDAILKVLSDRLLLDSFSRRIRDVIVRKFNSDDFAPAYIDLYGKVMSLKLV